MAINLQYLQASNGQPLTKSFTRNPDGSIEKSPYPRIKPFTSSEESIENTDELFESMQQHAATGHCLLKGQLDRPLVDESRAGHTTTYATTRWLVIDNDHLHQLSPSALMNLLGLAYVDYIVQ